MDHLEEDQDPIDNLQDPAELEIAEIQEVTADEELSKQQTDQKFSIRDTPMMEGEDESEEEQPLLYVDVNLGPEGNQRIVMYEGDDPNDVARKFADQYDLDQEMEERLQSLLKEQIQNVLGKIEEGEEED